MEKIQRLADQCWMEKFHYNEHDGPHDYYEFDYEKFAELIISECYVIAGENNSPETGIAILNHFDM